MKNEETPAAQMLITEGIAGYWHYHISKADKATRGLCGAKTMHTSIRLKDWRVPFGEHFPKRPTWCAECEKIAGLTLPARGRG